MNNSLSADWNRVREAFQRIWGYEDFRPPQGEIVRCLLQKQDALVVMPTGGGKSICFQLPALLQTGLTIVVSPLVALMENQVKALRDRQLFAASLHSELARSQYKYNLSLLSQNRLRLLYVSPETLLKQSVWEILSQPQLIINGLILDEAHCLVQWGELFRPAYRRLGAVRSSLLKNKPQQNRMAVAAFTATADTKAQRIISEVLQLRSPQTYLLNPYRENLALTVQIAWTQRCRRDRLFNFIRSRPKESGLVYVRTRKDGENLADWLQAKGLTTAAYHAGLTPEERRDIEAQWLDDRLPFVVSTSAFGMGIDKADVRWIVHFQSPILLSEYVQEIGRAGRDRQPAEALAFVSEPTGWLDPQDKRRRNFFERQARSQRKQAMRLAKTLPETGDVREISRQYKDGAIALSLLHSRRQLTWLDPFRYRMNFSAPISSSGGDRPDRDMVNYLYTRRCRWQFLLEAFGFDREARSMRCGKCDRCLQQRR